MMTTPPTPLGRWRYGIHRRAEGSTVRSLGRVELPLGESLRIELRDPDPAVDTVHLQYYIVTGAGPWALWVSCAPDDVEAREAELREVVPPFSNEPQDRPPSHGDSRGQLAGWEEQS
jgi:hypothetical protein